MTAFRSHNIRFLLVQRGVLPAAFRSLPSSQEFVTTNLSRLPERWPDALSDDEAVPNVLHG